MLCPFPVSDLSTPPAPWPQLEAPVAWYTSANSRAALRCPLWLDGSRCDLAELPFRPDLLTTVYLRAVLDVHFVGTVQVNVTLNAEYFRPLTGQVVPALDRTGSHSFTETRHRIYHCNPTLCLL